ncbi:hypothetical protein GCM10010123_33700 [Pilimelia anulata]|uniref:Uncharacterized protein n=1 Tax=Pilimelia anulata TaxID=53371 RepID=A0A8J3FBA3_9ACTN|nr:hypothetical protein [Pilimelia anulata]GGK00971.1 hypothetical protein GCM10010123_33700 [Pilimelia anulata]
MSALTALARARAAAAGVAQPTTTVRHRHVAARPLVCVPLVLAGEAHAPLAALVGTDRRAPRLLVVPQPRNRELRFAFAAALAAEILPYLDGHRGPTEEVPGREVRQRYLDAPQLWLPNPGGVAFVALLGRSLRFRRTDGEHPVPPELPLLGRWLTFLADRAELPGADLLVPATAALAEHWATGQSAVEDAHLAALLAWIDPPEGRTGPGAAAAAEDPAACPPAGPATDPTFDRDVLAPLMTAYDRGDPAAGDRLAAALRGQLAPVWADVWRAYDLLAALPAGASVAARWAADRDAFTGYAAHVDAGGPPQRRWDTAVGAAARLHRLERAASAYALQRAYDDPLVLAEYRLSGEAFAGEVVLADPTRIDDTGRRPVLRPRLLLRSADPVHLPPGTALCSPQRPKQRATLISVTGRDVVLELRSGMGRGRTPEPGSVPGVGERLAYTTLTDAFAPPPAFPPPEETPWTHGGPPAEEEPAASGTAPAAAG